MLITSELASITVCILHQVPILSEMLLPSDTHVLTAPLFLGEFLKGFILYRTIHFYGIFGFRRQGRGTVQGAGDPGPNSTLLNTSTMPGT